MMFGVNLHGTFFGFFGRECQVVVNADLHTVHFARISPTDIELVETGTSVLVVQTVDRKNLFLLRFVDGQQFGNLSKVGFVLLQQDDGVRIVYDAVLDDGIADDVVDLLCYLDDFPQNFRTVLFRYKRKFAIMGEEMARHASSKISVFRRFFRWRIFCTNRSMIMSVTMGSNVLLFCILSIS